MRFFIRGLSRSGIGWGVAQCCGLGSIANALGMPVISISSTNPWDKLAPYGSHPLTDPLCSSDRVRIQHIGCAYRRHEKLLHAELDLVPIQTDPRDVDWDDNLRLARAMDDAAAIRELERRLRRYRGKQLLRQIDELWLGGTLKTLKRKFAT